MRSEIGSGLNLLFDCFKYTLKEIKRAELTMEIKSDHATYSHILCINYDNIQHVVFLY